MAKRFFTPIQFDTASTGTPGVGQINWDSSNGTAQIGLEGGNVTLQVGQEHVVRVKNSSGSVAIPEGTAVMFAGATGDTVTVTPAVSSNVATYPSDYFVGITTEEIAADGFGFVTQYGFINHLNTNAWAVGTLLYVDPATAGGLISTRPAAPAWQTPVAAVTKQNSSAGRLLVRAIPGIQLGNVEGVALTTPATNDIIKYDSASGTWKNDNPLDVVSADTSYVTPTFVDSATNNGAFVTGGTFTITLPGTLATGDVVYTTCITTAASVTVSTPSGWTLLDSFAGGSGSSYLFYKVMGATPDTTVSFTIGTGSATLSGIAMAFRNASTSIGIIAKDYSSSGTRWVDGPTITTQYDSQMVLVMGGRLTTTSTVTGAPTGYSNLVYKVGTNYGVMAATKVVTSAGTSENPSAFTGTANSGAAYSYTIAINPKSNFGSVASTGVLAKSVSPITTINSNGSIDSYGHILSVYSMSTTTPSSGDIRFANAYFSSSGDLYLSGAQPSNGYLYANGGVASSDTTSTSSSSLSFNSGRVTSALGTSTNSGYISLYSGASAASVSTNSAITGSVSIYSGNASVGTTSTTTSGSINIYSGASSRNSGLVSIATGQASGVALATTTSGAITISTGAMSNAQATATSAKSGAITITTGDSIGAQAGSSGNITVDTGVATGAGTTGTISIGATNASALTLSRSGITTAIAGNATVAGTLGVTGDTTLTGDIAINGGDITTTSSTFNLLATNTGTQTYNIGTGVTTTGNTKTINLGTGGASGSTTAITMGSLNGTSSTNINGYRVNIDSPLVSVGSSGTARNFSVNGADGSIGTNGFYVDSNNIGTFSSTIGAGDTSPVLRVNRNTSDGNLVRLAQDGTVEGTISVSGTTVAYGTFAGIHWSQFKDHAKPDILPGTVLETIGEMCDWQREDGTYEDNDQLPKVKVSETAESPSVYGVFMTWDGEDGYNDLHVLSLGAWLCRIDASEEVEIGDLLVSAGNGCAKVQSDDIIRSKTIGKVTSTFKQTVYEDGSYLVPTVFYCG